MKNLQNKTLIITKDDARVVHGRTYENEKVFDFSSDSPESVDRYFSNELGVELSKTRATEAKRYGNAGSFNRQHSDLTLILEDVASQLSYNDDLSNFVSLDVRDTFNRNVMGRIAINGNGGFRSKLLNGDEGNLVQGNVSFGSIYMPAVYWGEKAQVNYFQQGAGSEMGLDILGEKTRAIADEWATGLLDTYMLGITQGTTQVTNGLLNMPAPVSVTNTTLVTKSLSSMTDAEFNTFLGGLIGQYAINVGYATAPDTFVIPTDDYMGLVGTQIGTGANANNGVFTRLARLEQALQQASGNVNARVLHSPYAMKAQNASGINKNVYALYRKDTLSALLPMDLRAVAPLDSEGFITEVAYVGSVSGILPKKSSGGLITYFVF